MPSIMNPWIILGLLAALALSAASGWRLRGDHERAKLHAQAVAYAEEIQRRQAAADTLAADLSAERERRIPKARTIIKEVVRYETLVPADRRCDLDGAWRLLHDAAATGEPAEPARLAAGDAERVADAAALETVAENYADCREWRAGLIGWQRWWREAATSSRTPDRPFSVGGHAGPGGSDPAD